jgi:uncharacterized protein YecE (DUF72 family)
VSVRIGISGWTYPPWRGQFYPPKLPHREELRYAASRLTALEINGSFYALQRPTSYWAWYHQVPEDFVLTVKAPRFITHLKKLRDVSLPVANFLASGPLALGDKLGPLLWQLPPMFGFNPQRLAEFFAGLPRSTGEAAYLARHHEDRLAGRAWTGTDADRPLRHAVEVRHDSFRDPAFIALLAEHAIAAVVADTAGRWPFITDLTADFVYVRLHGDEELYTSGYDAAALRGWADRIRGWQSGGRDVFVFFDNDVKVRAPYDAMSLIELIGPQAGAAPR